MIRFRHALVALLCAAPTLARADSLPDPGPWEACDKLKAGDACFSFDGPGYCVEKACPDTPGNCLYCDTEAMATTTASTGTTAATTGGTTAAMTGTTAASDGSSTGASSGGSSGATTDDTTTEKASGCGCRSEGSPAGALALLGLAGLLRRRR